MKISGFSFAKNSQQLYYPLVESIRSALPICDEFIIAVGAGDPEDNTAKLISDIQDPKIKIIHTDWAVRQNPGKHVFADQTDIALAQCSGDWCLYIQSDEVLHEKDHEAILSRCRELQDNPRVEGLLFDFHHIWGDYTHEQRNHSWYSREIRIIRNRCTISSYLDAQSFRRGDCKLNVARVDASMFHYGWARPPRLMQKKRKAFTAAYVGADQSEREFANTAPAWDYGSLKNVPLLKETHPAVMREWISRMDWADQLTYEGRSTARFSHDRLKSKCCTIIENLFFGGDQVCGFHNYKLLRNI